MRLKDSSDWDTVEVLTQLESVCRIVDSHDPRAEDLDSLLAHLSTELDCRVTVDTESLGTHSIPLDVGSGQTVFLSADAAALSAVIRAALAYAARAIEEALRRDFEEANFPVKSRGDLLNEFLLSEANTGTDALARLRRGGFAVDGHHLAARVDLRNLSLSDDDMADNYRMQLRAASMLCDGVSGGEEAWTTAGTNTSVLLVMSEHRRTDRHTEVFEFRLRAGLECLGKLDPSLDWAAGVGTLQSGPAGLRSTVHEATEALRAAQSEGILNRLHYFDRFGFARALIRWYEVDDVRTTIDEMLAPLSQLGDRKAADALLTLHTYLDSGQNVKQTAHRLDVHRNTVRYRIGRILDVLDIDLADPEQRLLVELGTRAMRIS